MIGNKFLNIPPLLWLNIGKCTLLIFNLNVINIVRSKAAHIDIWIIFFKKVRESLNYPYMLRVLIDLNGYLLWERSRLNRQNFLYMWCDSLRSRYLLLEG